MKECSRNFKVKTIFIAQDHFNDLGGKMIVIYPHMYGDVSLYDVSYFDQHSTESPKLIDDIVAASAESPDRTRLKIITTDGDVYEFLSIFRPTQVEYVNNIDYDSDYMYNAQYFAHEINLAVKRRESEQVIPVIHKPESEPMLKPTSTGDWIDPNTSHSISYSTDTDDTDTLLNDQYKLEMDHQDFPKPTSFSSIHESWQGG